MRVIYVARINEEDYEIFRRVMTPTLPKEYAMWLRVREKAKSRSMREHGATCLEVEISTHEFYAYCKGLKKPDFSVAALDRCARAKALPSDTHVA